MSIGERMKGNYEAPAKYLLMRRTPVIVRVDGKAFHTFTRGMERPFDQRLIDAMIVAATFVAEEMQGFKAGYVQSDEVSFLITDYDSHETEMWFGGVKSKIETITASMMTAAFNRALAINHDAYFDARAFNIPQAEIANYFLWRMQDWQRNSLTMYCSSFFSHKELHGRPAPARHEMLHAIGKNWATDLCDQHKNGTWIDSDFGLVSHVPPVYDAIINRLGKECFQ